MLLRQDPRILETDSNQKTIKGKSEIRNPFPFLDIIRLPSGTRCFPGTPVIRIRVHTPRAQDSGGRAGEEERRRQIEGKSSGAHHAYSYTLSSSHFGGVMAWPSEFTGCSITRELSLSRCDTTYLRASAARPLSHSLSLADGKTTVIRDRWRRPRLGRGAGQEDAGHVETAALVSRNSFED